MELDCSDGAKMVLERMKTHPDEFCKGGRFWDLILIATGEILGAYDRFHLSGRDRAAIAQGYTEVVEAKFTEMMVSVLVGGELTPQERDAEQKKIQMQQMNAAQAQAQLKQLGNMYQGAGGLGAQAANVTGGVLNTFLGK